MNNSIFFAGENPIDPHHLTIRKDSPANWRRRFFISRFLPILSVVALVSVLVAPALMPPKGQAAAALTGAGVASRRTGFTAMPGATSPFASPVRTPLGVGSGPTVVYCDPDLHLLGDDTNTPIAFTPGQFNVLSPNSDGTFSIAGSGLVTGTTLVQAATGTATDGTQYVAVVTRQASRNFLSIIFAKKAGTFTVCIPFEVTNFTTICTFGFDNSDIKDSLGVTNLNNSRAAIYQINGIIPGQPQESSSIDLSAFNPTQVAVANLKGVLGAHELVMTTRDAVLTAGITSGIPGVTLIGSVPLPGMNTIRFQVPDGSSGVVVFNRSVGQDATLLNNNNGTLLLGPAVHFTTVVNDLVVAPFTDPGLEDLVEIDTSSPNATLFPNNGSGGFNPGVSVPLGVSPSSLGTFNITTGSFQSLIIGDSNAPNVVSLRNTAKPPIELTKTVSPAGDAHPGDQLTYKLHIVNNGPVPEKGGLSDVIPAGTTFLAGSGDGGDVNSRGVFVANFATIGPSEFRDVSFAVIVNALGEKENVVTNFAVFEFAEDFALSNNVQTLITPTPAPDFSISFDQPTITAQVGTKARVTVNINRIGGFTGNVTVTPPLPSGGIKAKPPDPMTTTEGSVTFKMKIGAGVALGSYPLTFTATDDSGRTRTAAATLIVQ